MSDLLIALCIGLVAAVIDVTPMIIKNVNKSYTLSAFFFWLFLGVIIPQVEIFGLAWLDGIVVSFMVLMPLLPLVAKLDKKAIPIMFVMTALLGAGVGFVSELVL